MYELTPLFGHLAAVGDFVQEHCIDGLSLCLVLRHAVLDTGEHGIALQALSSGHVGLQDDLPKINVGTCCERGETEKKRTV